jgi:tetratricopeptide (TPR) repeat protein
LSLSRGTWIVALATIALAIFLLKPDRSRFLLGVAIAAAAGFAAAAAISRSALFFLPRWREAAEGAPEFSIRLTYWRDSLQMIRDHLWFGTGEGGWALLQSAYRSESYYVAYVHNHYVQLLLDVGVVGLLLFLGGTAWHGGRVLRRLLSGESQEGRTRAGLATLLSFALLFHAGADITLQFPLLFALLLLALAWTEERSPLPTAGRARSYGAATLAFLFAFLQLWAAAGYIDKTQGMKAGRNGAFAEGEERLQRAEAMLPWASSPAYELAKLYVRRGNETGSAEDYRAAKEALERALLLLPEHTEYAALLEELHTIIGNNEGGEPFE